MGEILSRLGRFGINPGLDNIRAVLEILGHPEKGMLAFQVVGTNGKGSTAAAIDSILQSAGYRTGRYTSPHLTDVRERILLSGEMIPSVQFENLARDLASVCTRNRLNLTFFEFLTVTAFMAFSQSDCQIMVLEAGMGGRWDATTVSDPCLTVLTQVERDHEEILGHGIERIFEEKVAVGRQGRPFVATLSEPFLRERFIEKSRKAGYIPVLNHRDFEGEWIASDNMNGEPRPFRYNGRWGHRQLASSLSATYQIDNLAGALAAIEWSNLPVSPRVFRDGLLNLKNPGRLEQIKSDPPVLLDGAHNPAAIQALCTSLRDRFGPGREFGFFVGIHASKDWKDMLGRLAEEGSAFFFPFPSDNEMPPLPVDGAWVLPSNLVIELGDPVGDGGTSLEIREGRRDSLLKDAISWAKAKPCRVLVVTGSLYLVGAVRTLILPATSLPLFSLNERDLPGPDPS